MLGFAEVASMICTVLLDVTIFVTVPLVLWDKPLSMSSFVVNVNFAPVAILRFVSKTTSIYGLSSRTVVMLF